MIPFLPILFAAPARAGFVESRLAAVEAYRERVQKELDSARSLLEDLQELSLEPHRDDPRVDLALLRLDAAEAYLRAGLDTIRSEVARDTAPPAGWRPFEEEVAEAKKLVRDHESELGARLEEIPVVPRPLPGLALAQVKGTHRIEFRGYFAVNPVPTEWLAVVLAHEATHIRQYEKAKAAKKTHRYSLADELEAREVQAKLWIALGAPESKDWDGKQGECAQAFKAGPEAFQRYVAVKFKEEPDWLWIEPEVAAPPKPPTPGLGELEAKAKSEGASDADALAARLKKLVDFVASIKKGSALAASERLKNARVLLEDFPELAAPSPRVVNVDRIETKILDAVDRPPAQWLFYQAVHPALIELDRVREALGLRRLGKEERGELAGYLASGARPPKTAVDGLAPAASSATLALVGAPDLGLEKAHPDWIFVPGEKNYRTPDPGLAHVWAVEALAERAGRGEAEALDEAEQAFTSRPGGKDAAVPLRFAAEFDALDEGGRPLLQLYLDSRKD